MQRHGDTERETEMAKPEVIERKTETKRDSEIERRGGGALRNRDSLRDKLRESQRETQVLETCHRGAKKCTKADSEKKMEKDAGETDRQTERWKRH